MSKSDEGGLFREIVMGLVLPLVKLCRTYEYTVKHVYEDGRMDLAPANSKIAPKLAGVPQWGPSGTRATPRIGSAVAVNFLDGDHGKPVVSSFTPLGTQVGRPRKIEIDTAPDGSGDGIVLARGTLPCGRGGARLVVFGTGTSTMTLQVMDPDGRTYSFDISGANAGGAVVFAIVPSPHVVAAGGAAVIDAGNPEVLV